MMLDDPSVHQTTFTLEDVAAIRTRFLVLGLINIILGMAAIVLPKIANISLEVIIGAALCLAGIADAWHAMLLRSKRGYMLSWVSSVLLVVAGALILVSPVAPFTSLHIAIAILFWLAGMLRIGKGLDIRPVNNWPWVVASGLLMFLFGTYIMYQDSISWTLMSLLIGISLIVDGWSRMILFWVHD
jgi:uncharacterized membrane protein HdeD (DUF308 family)